MTCPLPMPWQQPLRSANKVEQRKLQHRCVALTAAWSLVCGACVCGNCISVPCCVLSYRLAIDHRITVLHVLTRRLAFDQLQRGIVCDDPHRFALR